MRNRNLNILLSIVIVFGILSTLAWPWNEAVKNTFIDLQFKIRGSRRLSDKIALVYISDEDIKAINSGRDWPITRDYYGYLVYILNQLGARIIGIDVLFSAEDRFYPEYDNAFAEAIGSAGNVCLPITFSELNFDGNKIPAGNSPTFPIQILRDRSAGLGFSNFDHDRIIRAAPLAAAVNDTFIFSFGCELARLYLAGNGTAKLLSDRMQIENASGVHYSFPLAQNSRLRLNHFGDIQNVKSISLVGLLQAFEAHPDSLSFEDKIVIVAVTAPGVMKIASTPLSSALPASLIHATVLENIIERNYLKEIPLFIHWIIIILLVASIWLIFRVRSKAALISGIVGILLCYWIIAIILFSLTNTIVPLFYPTLAFLVTSAYFEFRRNIERRLEEYALRILLSDQIRTKESQLEEARSKLVEAQAQLSEETMITEQIGQLAAERETTIHKLEKELSDLQTYIVPSRKKLEFAEIIYAGNSKMAHVLELVTTVSSDNIPVLIMGETGTGKEMVARAIHNSSNRKAKPFVAINCGALSETLLESELFGHEKGSFTGAHSRRRGRFELADGGTVFLDEITETSPAFQTRLLRVLQEASFERLGGEQTIKVDLRIIAATNKNLQVEMEKNHFRADLFYRLNGFPITIPPLRERQDDIPLLAQHFLKKYNYTSITAFSDRAMESLKNYHWQGNVRELENVVRRAAILAQSEKRNMIQDSDLPKEIIKSKFAQATDYKPIEDQILETLRLFDFSRSAISQTATALGNRDRGTITEYFRGICFENLVNSNFNIQAAARAIANSKDEAIIERVKTKIDEYLSNLRGSLTDFDLNDLSFEQLSSQFKGLPKKYHPYLLEILKNYKKMGPQK